MSGSGLMDQDRTGWCQDCRLDRFGRLDEMCGRLVDAMASSSDRGQVKALADLHASLRRRPPRDDRGNPPQFRTCFESVLKDAGDAVAEAGRVGEHSKDDEACECGGPGLGGLCLDCWSVAVGDGRAVGR